MNYISTTEIADRWNVSARWVRKCCIENKIPGCIQSGGIWQIPANASKPIDNRTRSGRKKPAAAEHLVLFYNPDYPRNTPEAYVTEDDRILCDIQNTLLCGDPEDACSRITDYCSKCKDPDYLLTGLQIHYLIAFYLGDPARIAGLRYQIEKAIGTGKYPLTRAYLALYLDMENRITPLLDLPSNLLPLFLYVSKGNHIYEKLRKGSLSEVTALELDCRSVEGMNNETITVCFHLILATYYQFSLDPELYEFHVKKALEIILRRKWYLFLAVYSLWIDWNLEQVLDSETLFRIKVLSEQLAENIFRWILRRNSRKKADDNCYRLLRVAALVAGGRTNDEICKSMNLSLYTVKRCIKTLYECSGIDNRKDLTDFVLKLADTI